ncbi:FadR/GntR family transcriptional regulator [Devosia sp. ZB163]|uniref:FadR/GntR family transcriptional regulator n=1 Tax=Devosia sp. ZB163 TaxID=3025938 RepID=UPI00235DE0F9|nr:FadR/GntR family transcriptional regulator [Devosia sp. ZB163]MDC9825694.1 FadR/GntR family transcriptional regulator [Devosia sp. ZB163]
MSAAPTVHLTDRVKLGLLRLIETDNLQPGDKLPPAEQLCEKFSVSRTVVREAIASLKAEGRLRSLRGSGVYVETPSATTSELSMFMAAPQEIGDILDFMEFRISVEVEAAGLAAERRTETHLLRMEQALAQFRRHLTDNTLGTEADRAFHRAIADATNNNRFRLFVDEMGERLLPRRALGASFADEKSKADFLDAIQLEHRRIYEAIADRKPDEARIAMRRHLEDGRRRYREWRIAHDTR